MEPEKGIEIALGCAYASPLSLPPWNPRKGLKFLYAGANSLAYWTVEPEKGIEIRGRGRHPEDPKGVVEPEKGIEILLFNIHILELFLGLVEPEKGIEIRPA